MIRQLEYLNSINVPNNLKINDRIRELRARCRGSGCNRPYHHLAFGQSPFSPPPSVIAELRRHAAAHSYLPTAGLPELREAVASYYCERQGFDCTAEQVVVSPGSKEMIAMALTVLEGPVIIPTPSWVSYLPQARLVKKHVVPVRTRREDGFKLTPADLKRAARGATQSILLLNNPHNPTGAVYSRPELEQLAEVCRQHGIVVVADEIYAGTVFAPEAFTSMNGVYPEATIVTGGISKDRSSGGYRFGVGIFPRQPESLVRNVVKIAGSTYSCVAAPVQYAALEAYSSHVEVSDYVERCRRINRVVGRRVARIMSSIPGVVTSIPHAAFYLFVDFIAYREDLRRMDIGTCASFCDDILSAEHVAMLSGDSLLLDPDEFATRCSYVDYDGDAALVAWTRRPPRNESEEDAFVRENCPLLVEGAHNVARYLSAIHEGRRPDHETDPSSCDLSCQCGCREES